MSRLACALFWIVVFPIVAAAETVTITSPSPSSGQLITNGCIQVYAIAQSSTGSAITSWRIYVDGKDSGFRAPNTARINTRLCVPSVSIAQHSVYVRAWSSDGVSGASPSVSVTISSAYKIVAPVDEALSPVAGQSFNNGLIRVATSAWSPYQLNGWIVYIDGQKAFTSYKGAIQVKTDLPVPNGTHSVTVKLWNVNGVITKYSAGNIVVTKDAMYIPPFVTPPSNAVTMQNLDDQGVIHWKKPITGAVASCRKADIVCAAMSPVAVMDPVQFVATPTALPVASDGMAALFETLSGTEPYGNALYGSSIFDNDPTRVNFVSDMWVMLTNTNVQTVELDLYTTVNGTTFMMGAQCDFASGHWDFWDDTPQQPPAHAHWQKVFPTPQNNDLVCNIPPNQWTHVRINAAHDASTYHFVSIEINGVNHSLSALPASSTTPRGWPNGTAVQVQLDANNSATPNKVYIDNDNVTKW